MRDEEIDELVQTSIDELEAKQDVLCSAYGIGTYERFWFDQQAATVEFRDSSESPWVVAAVVPVGSYSSRSGTWMWAWANETLLVELRSKAESLRQLADVTGMAAFTTPIISVKPELASKFAALAVKHLNALGAYRVSGDASDLYLAITDVTRVS